MTVKIEKFTISSKGFDDFIEITPRVSNIVLQANTNEGIANVFVGSSTAGVAILETEFGLCSDISKILETIVPINKIYQHDNNWQEGNANAHLKKVFIGNSITLPILNGKLEIKPYQKIVLIDFNNKSDNIEINVGIIY